MVSRAGKRVFSRIAGLRQSRINRTAAKRSREISGWTFTNIRPRTSSPASAFQPRAAALPTARNRRLTGPARSAATAGSSRRRSIAAGAARPAASSCAAARTRSRRQPTSCSASGWSRSRPGRPARWSIALYVEAAVAIKREIYLGFVLDRVSERVMVVASSSGGMEIEEIAVSSPQSIIRDRGRAGGGNAGISGARDRLRARHRSGARPGGGQGHTRRLQGVRGTRRDDGGDQSAGHHRGRAASWQRTPR